VSVSSVSRRAIVFLLLPLLALGAAPPAHAGPTPAAGATPAAAATSDGARLQTASRSRPIAPGVTLTSFDRYGPDPYSGRVTWLRGDAIVADLTKGATVDYLFPGRVAAAEPLSVQADRVHAVAAVNGDFFDINNSNAPHSTGVQSGQTIVSPGSGRYNAAVITPDGLGRIAEVVFTGTATLPGGRTVALTQANNHALDPNGVGVFTSLWGSYPRARAVVGATRVTEVVVTDNVVTSVAPAAGAGPIPDDTFVLLGRDAGADALAGLAVGDRVTVSYETRTRDDMAIKAALGGWHVIVADGVAQKLPAQFNDPTAPRTSVGFSADGTKMFMLTVDGRQPAFADGVGLDEMAQLMVELGAHTALHLDGGGSSTLVAREPGSATVQVENTPSDGSERPVPNGLAIFAPQGSGRLTGFWVETAMDPDRAPGSLTNIYPGNPDRVFPGLTRRLTAAGHDETYGPAAGTPRWRANPAVHGTVDQHGVFRAAAPGTTTVTAFDDDTDAKGEIRLTVLQPLHRIRPTTERISLAGAGATASFGVVGYDREGASAPIEPADVRLEYDPALLEVTPDPSGYLTVKARADVGGTVLTVRVGAATASVPVTVGLQDVVVADFEDAAQWWYNSVPADIPGSVSPAPGRVGTGLRLQADFTRHSVTRAAYANPPRFIDVPGQPQEFTMWIHGDGNGGWPSLHLVAADGSQPVLRGPNITWTGWRQITFTVPPGVAYPVKIRRFYAPEIHAEDKYHGDIVIDEIVAKVPPSVTTPPEDVVADRVVGTGGDVAEAPWRFAVMSDAQFTADNPDSELVRQARRTLREIKAQRPDFLVINGDFVDRATLADLELAKRILDEELAGELPYYYVPGNHEIMGAPISNFTSVFGDAYRSFDHKGTRFITLDSSTGTLRGGGFDQVALLRARLDAAAADPTIGSVVVLQHIPPRDPTPAKASELNDRKEAALLEQWLADFQRTTGKGAAFIGAHVGTFHADRADGVPFFINGNSAKSPSTPADRGGFTGWSLWGVDPVTPQEAQRARRDWFAGGPTWIAAEVRPHVDALEVRAPATATVGAPASVDAVLTQAGRQVPVAYPVSADWTASPNVHIGPLWGLRPWHVAWFDPAAGRLLGLRPGTVTLAVTVNGVTDQATVTVAAAGASTAGAASGGLTGSAGRTAVAAGRVAVAA